MLHVRITEVVICDRVSGTNLIDPSNSVTAPETLKSIDYRGSCALRRNRALNQSLCDTLSGFTLFAGHVISVAES